uniref:hypothetical protein n=1 Tax=Enterocloster clostridioformis TaxID=1531 RepID=UPI00138ED4AE|nr:hypothetical protein [Enterocloster clostridioformis]
MNRLENRLRTAPFGAGGLSLLFFSWEYAIWGKKLLENVGSALRQYGCQGYKVKSATV